MRRRRATVATPGEWQCKTARSGEWAQHFFKCFLFTKRVAAETLVRSRSMSIFKRSLANSNLDN